jgi:general secretion pathway protein D
MGEKGMRSLRYPAQFLGVVALALAALWNFAARASATPEQRAAIAAAINETVTPPQAAAEPNAHGGAEIIPASGALLGSVTQRVSRATVTDDGGITLNFVNADVKDVAKTVLGDYLKLNYEIAPNVQGTVTIQTSRPLPRSKILAILDQTLRLNGMAIVLSNGIYKVVTGDDAARESSSVNPIATRHRSVPGYGVEIAPVRYVSAIEMQKLLEPLAPLKAIVHVDTARNVLIIEGTEQERQTLLDDIALFDTDWLAGMSFGLFTPTYMDSQELARELTQVLGGVNSPATGVVRIVPIDRLNMVLVVSPQRRYIDQLRAWVSRLDRPGQGTDRRIYVYSVQHGRATDLASTLTKTLFGSGGASAQGNIVTPQSGSSSLAAPQPAQANPTASPNSETGIAASVETDTGASAQGLNGIRINADETNNALVILATPQQYARVEEALARLDLTPLQVLLEAAIAEVTLGDKLQFGVQYTAKTGSSQTILSSGSSPLIAPTFPGLSYLLTTSNIQIILDELSSVTHVEVLSSPQLMVLNNQTATLQVGDQVPILTQQSVGTVDQNAPIVNSIQYQNTGVILKVTPRVNRSGEVMMDISQEVSDAVPATAGAGIQSPTIQERKIASSVAIQDGETVALGGLITRDISRTKSGVPFLQDVPLIGDFFSDTQNNNQKTELIVLITPHVVDNVQRARALTEELRHRLSDIEPLMQMK